MSARSRRGFFTNTAQCNSPFYDSGRLSSIPCLADHRQRFLDIFSLPNRDGYSTLINSVHKELLLRCVSGYPGWIIYLIEIQVEKQCAAIFPRQYFEKESRAVIANGFLFSQFDDAGVYLLDPNPQWLK